VTGVQTCALPISISFAKSLIRMGACIGLLFSTGAFVLGMVIAEILGIVEEL